MSQERSSDYKNVQQAVDSLLGVGSIIKYKKKKTTDKRRELFVQMINHLDQAITRATLAYTDLEMDLSRYDEKYFIIIDILIYMGFGESCSELISYYLWDRYSPDGSIIPMYKEDGTEIILNSPYDLWDMLCQVNPKIIE
jgi:hypothetical protein